MEEELYEDFARFADDHWWVSGRRAVLRQLLRRSVQGSALDILDVGCGTGGNLELLSEFGRVEGLDSSPIALHHCRKKYGERFPLYLGEAPGSLPPGRQFDLVAAFDVIEHIPSPVEVLRGLGDALRPGGLLACTVPAYPFLWSEYDEVNHHFKRYTEGQLGRELAEAGLSVELVTYFNAVLFPPIAVARLLRRWGFVARRDTELSVLPGPVNTLLRHAFSSERLWLREGRLPFGVSLFAAARR